MTTETLRTLRMRRRRGWNFLALYIDCGGTIVMENMVCGKG
jgi:hypothetical protein